MVRSPESASTPISGWKYQHGNPQDRNDFQDYTAGELRELEREGDLDFADHPALQPARPPTAKLRELARLALVYDDDEGPYRGYLHATYPRLHGLYNAARWLGQAWRTPETEDLDDLHLDKVEPADLLMDEWRKAVQRIADGQLPEG
jgi:hypothetical protein